MIAVEQFVKNNFLKLGLRKVRDSLRSINVETKLYCKIDSFPTAREKKF